MARRKRNRTRQNKNRSLITQLNPRSPIAEQYRTLRTNLQYASVDLKLQTILFTSATPDAGKSMTTANLAVVYAQQEKKVLLIDSDLRKPTAHYTFRLDNLSGLSNILVGDGSIEDVANRTSVDNLDVISSGPIPPNPSELLGSHMMKKLIEDAKRVYDIIIFDTPPILAVTDAQVLASIVDGTVLVVRSEQTEYEAAIKAKEVLEKSSANLLGTVLNDVEKKYSNYYYYYS